MEEERGKEAEAIRCKKVRSTFLLLNCLFEFYAGITGATFVLFLYSKGLDAMENDSFERCFDGSYECTVFLWKWYDGISGCTDLFGVCLRF